MKKKKKKKMTMYLTYSLLKTETIVSAMLNNLYILYRVYYSFSFLMVYILLQSVRQKQRTATNSENICKSMACFEKETD